MPDKRAHSQSVGKAVFSIFRSLALAGLVAGSAALFTHGCTDESGNGHFMQPNADGAPGGSGGAGGDGAGGTSGGDSGGGTSGGGTSGGGSGGSGGASSGGTGGGGGAGGTSGGGTGGNNDASTD